MAIAILGGVAWMFLAKPNIQANCTTNGFGRGSCTFNNKGFWRGRTCVHVMLVPDMDEASKRLGPFENLNFLAKNRFALLTSEEVCSGNLDSGDVVERGFSGFADVRAIVKGEQTSAGGVSPVEMCKPSFIASDVSWTDLCSQFTVPADDFRDTIRFYKEKMDEAEKADAKKEK